MCSEPCYLSQWRLLLLDLRLFSYTLREYGCIKWMNPVTLCQRREKLTPKYTFRQIITTITPQFRMQIFRYCLAFILCVDGLIKIKFFEKIKIQFSLWILMTCIKSTSVDSISLSYVISQRRSSCAKCFDLTTCLSGSGIL